MEAQNATETLLDEEVLESRDYGISDEIVYFFEAPVRNLESGYRHMDWGPDYKIGRCWIDLYFVLERNRNNQFLATIEISKLPLDSFGENLETERGVADRHCGVLVDIAQFVKLPKRVTLDPLPSVVRLKRLDDFDCLGGHKLGVGLERHSSRFAVDRKGRVFGPTSTQQRKLPRKLIKSRSQVVGKLADKKRDLDWERKKFKPENMNSLFKIIFSRTGHWFLPQKDFERKIKFLEMAIRPSGFFARVL